MTLPYEVASGMALILVPAPTTADDLAGVRKFTKGVIQVAYGITEFVIALRELK